jgi:uncharacterized protein (TIGR00661 family)
LSKQDEVKKRTRFVGPLVAWRREEIEPVDLSEKAFSKTSGPHIVVSLGGHQYRKPLFDAVLAVASRFPNVHFHLLTSFQPEFLPIASNISIHGIVKNAPGFFKAADLVITQAGHSTAMELLTLGKPAIIVPDTKQTEQENNASRMVELGVAEKLSYTDLDIDKLADTIQKFLDCPQYQAEATLLADKAAEIDGAAQAANVLKEYAFRLLAY